MIYSIFADTILLLHLIFILFVGLGGLLSLKWPRLAWLHLPAVGWALWITFSGAICPLTPLEQALRNLAGERSYSGSFLDHYIEPLIYPAGLTQTMQWNVGFFVLLINLAIYLWLLRRWHKSNPVG
ncbi:Protein of Unknown function (DUF2784) [Mariprofundus ferrinatatus]|uniref:DUF2784 domain-containing protein n=1 Tax=Mariprofundus ferrinatatus TaxID=1921087 RepID=A0A2K8L4X8_9PROT|nr:DUF2784 domain-containing protein [Mariprofundus ferrinatatus]ATX80901.1 Protein of Unknown function (DUF2784) [Mariprofundus ferrinatatus]